LGVSGLVRTRQGSSALLRLEPGPHCPPKTGLRETCLKCLAEFISPVGSGGWLLVGPEQDGAGGMALLLFIFVDPSEYAASAASFFDKESQTPGPVVCIIVDPPEHAASAAPYSPRRCRPHAQLCAVPASI
jgi:hypothetical protein